MRLFLFGGRAPADTTPTTPPTPTTPAVHMANVPTAPDSTIAAMRPTSTPLGVLRVNPAGTGGAYTSLTAAVAAAKQLQVGKAPHPNRRVDIVVDPGDYNEDNLLPSAFTAFYASDPTPGATRLVRTNVGTNSHYGVLYTEGNLWWEGIDVILTKPVGEESSFTKYPIHHTADGTSVFSRATIRSSNPGGGGHSVDYPLYPFGMDGINGGTTVLYQCSLGVDDPNLHGSNDLLKDPPETLIYVGCTSHTRLSYSALVDNAADEVWVVGCTAQSVYVEGAGCTLHLSGSTIAGTVTAPHQDSRSDWPVPSGGLSASDRALYGV